MIRSGTLALAVVLLAGVARAQPTDVAKADTLFREGRALMKNGNYETACPKLEESYRLDPAAGTGINLGDCFEKQGKVASALLAYQAARALLKPGDPRIGPVEKEIAALDKRAPRLTIKLASGAPEGTTVKRDGREVEASKLGVPVAVNPGKVKVVVSAPGRESAVFRVTLVEGTSRGLEVEPAARETRPEGSASPRPASAPSSHESTTGSVQQTVGWGVFVAGLLATAAGTKFAFDWHDRKAEFDRQCKGRPCANYDDLDDDLKESERNTWLGFGMGAALVGTGVALIVLAPSPDNTPAATRLRFGPRLSSHACRMQLEGAWQ
ncbi:MAG: hypothetical protein IPM35_00035 [Myxococcales bacterium]|nr:hypothetical protein [Myxococcales bacterium]